MTRGLSLLLVFYAKLTENPKAMVPGHGISKWIHTRLSLGASFKWSNHVIFLSCVLDPKRVVVYDETKDGPNQWGRLPTQY